MPVSSLDFLKKLDVTGWEHPLDVMQIQQTQARLSANNPGQSTNIVNLVENWDIIKFREPHLPIVIDEIKDKQGFSYFDDQHKVRVLDMAIFMPSQGWKVPAFLEPFEEAIKLALKAEKAINPDFAKRFVHITIDQKIVPPDKPGRRAGLHSDAQLTGDNGEQLDVTADNRRFIAKRFGKSDHAYIVHDVLPTDFYPGPFPLDTEQAITTFEEVAAKQNPVHYPNYSMLRLNAYDVHTAVMNKTGIETPRSFFKMQFTENLLERDINTINPDFDYEKERKLSALSKLKR